ncbi:hypothetical protein VINI7043_21726 [Vibrio nigripulchritudo ATCC 27043]|uniref:Nmad2 family putative nucleotide modification protein n=1 Tax=Vibrio nigripulchritudo TaxID=28173 RepID=UPI00021C1EF3|nr:hypothetical protein [Vibrio nigripulchritudo]EGU61059.1 hypothetical protein VINI7043_21726 [Vibrio nigripulchritudo ATCC 27043]
MGNKYFSYVIPRDYGFAPNPFGHECTLATCKPNIRKSARVGDWIFGTSSTAGGVEPRLVFAMKVTRTTNFNDYYHDSNYQYKKPVMNGSLKKMYGDNIYHKETDDSNKIIWNQDDSHHSNPDGSPNPLNIDRDTGITDKVLISDEFYYFGDNGFDIPSELVGLVCKRGPGHRFVSVEHASKLLSKIKNKCDQGINGDPIMFRNEFQRYDGK